MVGFRGAPPAVLYPPEVLSPDGLRLCAWRLGAVRPGGRWAERPQRLPLAAAPEALGWKELGTHTATGWLTLLYW